MIRLIVRPFAEEDIADARAYFVLPDDDHAVVVAILHQSRAPRAWKRRAKTERVG